MLSDGLIDAFSGFEYTTDFPVRAFVSSLTSLTPSSLLSLRILSLFWVGPPRQSLRYPHPACLTHLYMKVIPCLHAFTSYRTIIQTHFVVPYLLSCSEVI